MSGEGPSQSNPERPRIELVPSGAHSVPRYVLKEDGEDISHEQLPYAVPAQPVHLCPSCDYNLTGLRTRRCPECGTLFDLLEARRRGARTQPRVLQDYRAVFANNLALFGGLGLFVGSLGGAAILLRNSRGAWPAWITFLGIVILFMAWTYRILFSRSLADAALFAGVAATALAGGLIVLLL